MAETLDRYGIQLSDAVSATVTKQPVVPGLEPAKPAPEAVVPGKPQQLQHTEQMPPLPFLPAQRALTKQEQQNLPPEQAPVPNGRPQTLPPPQ